jgi:hypothetical protein
VRIARSESDIRSTDDTNRSGNANGEPEKSQKSWRVSETLGKWRPVQDKHNEYVSPFLLRYRR